MKRIRWQLVSTLILLIIALTACGSQPSSEMKETNVPKEESNTESSPSEAISAFIEQYNIIADVPITNPIEIDIHASEYYRTEFRLNAFKNAVAKRCSIGESTIDIINYGNLANDKIRLYLSTDDEEFAIQVFKNAVGVFDTSVTNEEMNEAVEDIRNHTSSSVLNKIGFSYIPTYQELFVDNPNIDFYTKG